MTTKDDKDFENFTKCGIFGDLYSDSDVKVKDYYHIIWKIKRLCTERL